MKFIFMPINFLFIFLGIASCNDGSFHGGTRLVSVDATAEDAGKKKKGKKAKKKKHQINPDFVPEYDADSVSIKWGSGLDFDPDFDGDTTCFYGDYGSEASNSPAAFVQHTFDVVEGDETIYIKLTFSPNFVDNSYGTNAMGWGISTRGHTFKDLVGSDHAIINITSDAGDFMSVKLDYISELSETSWGNLGVLPDKKDEAIGDTSHIAKTMTSLDRNLNERGYSSYTVNSPATDSKYSANPDAPNWDFRVIYEVWIYSQYFKSLEGIKPSIKEVHASPSKTGNNTLIVEERSCPPEVFD